MNLLQPLRHLRLFGGMPKLLISEAWLLYWCRFASNIGILLLNKHLLGGYGFRYPVFLTLCHMLACLILSQVFLNATLSENLVRD